jgi:hypothetical protein
VILNHLLSEFPSLQGGNENSHQNSVKSLPVQLSHDKNGHAVVIMCLHQNGVKLILWDRGDLQTGRRTLSISHAAIKAMGEFLKRKWMFPQKIAKT